jgi:acetoacetyl-CoA reductase
MNDSTDRSTRTAVVTGGMGCLGTSICQRLKKEGMKVFATHSPGNEHVERWLLEQRNAGFDFETCSIDVSHFGSCRDAVAHIVAEVGAVDVLVNNAGITRDALTRKMSLEDWHLVLRTDLDSVFNMTRQVLDGMTQRRWGRIINISSINGQRGAFGQANYAAAKAGIHGFTKAVALEVAKMGVTVNTVSPGYLRTSMVMKVPEEILRTKILPEIPMGRLGEPDEVADLIGFLASDQSSFITGANMAINGGQHMY